MEDKKKGLIVLGVGAVAAIPLILLGRKAKAAPPVPENAVGIALRNPPSGATTWQLAIYDWDEVSHISKFGLVIVEPAGFDIPPSWTFPLRVDILIYTPPATIYYRMHSTENAFPQFHREVFIPSFGNYYYNVAKEEFERVS